MSKNGPSSARSPWFLSDVPVSSVDADSFGHQDLANNLEEAIRSNRGRVMIGLLGGFGVGKSSVIGLLQQRLAGQRPVLRISAERHEIPVFHRAFVFAFAEAVERAGLLSRDKIETELEVLNYSSTQQLSDLRLAPAVRVISRLVGKLGGSIARRALVLGGVAPAAVVVAFVICLAFGLPVVEELWTWLIGLIAVAAAAPVLSVLLGLASGHGLAALGSAFKPGMVNRLRPRVEAADEYERVFAQLVRSIPNDIVVAVDDIDRLSAGDVLPALNAIRSFQLTGAKQPAFIVSVDEEVIARAIRDASPSLAGADADDNVVAEYLSRLFTHRQQMPPHAFADLRAYARQLLTAPPHPALPELEANLDSVVQVLIYDGVANPRHVIRLVNAFLADFRLALLREQRSGTQSMKDGTVTDNPKVLARLAVLRMDFPQFYRVFTTNIEILTRIEEVARADADPSSANAIAESIGFLNSSKPEYKALEAYISRTAGWVEEVEDLLPFIYLGQDEIDRAVGSATVRRVRSILANGLTAEFLSYIKEADGISEITSALNLVRSTVDGLTGPELSNALTVLDGAAAATTDERWLHGLAESFATSVRRSPTPDLTVRGLSRLAAAAVGLQRTLIMDVLLERDESDLDWGTALIEERPEMNPTIGGSPEMGARIEAALALIGREADLDRLAQVGPALSDPINSHAAASAVGMHLEVLARVEPDASEVIRATTAKLAREAGTSLDVSELLAPLRKLISEPGSVSSAVGFDVATAMNLQEPQPLAYLAFDIALRSISDGKFRRGVDEDYLAGGAPILLTALEHSSTWTRGVDGDKVALPRAVAQLLALATEHFSWIDGFTEPLLLALADNSTELSPVVAVISNSFERYTTHKSSQQEWDLVMSVMDRLEPGDRQTVIDTLIRTLASGDNEIRAIAVGKLPAFLKTTNGAASATAMAESLETQLSRSAVHLIDALEVILNAPEVTAARQQSVAQNIANVILPYGPPRDAAIAALCGISWKASVRAVVAQLVAGYPSSVTNRQALLLSDGLEPLAAPPAFAAILETAAAAYLELGDAISAAAAIGNVSPALTASLALAIDDDLSDALSAWLQLLGDDRNEALDALFATVQDKSVDRARAVRVVAAYANADPESFDSRVIAQTTAQVVDHTRTIDGRGWGLLLEQSSEETIATVADQIISAWTQGSSSDAAATGELALAANSVPKLDARLANAIAPALRRWTQTTPDDATAAILGTLAMAAPQLQAAARSELDRPGPRKADSRSAFRSAKAAFGLKV